MYPLTPPLSYAGIQLRQLLQHFLFKKFTFTEAALVKTPAGTPQIKYRQVKQGAAVSRVLEHLKEPSSLLAWGFYSGMLQSVSPE